MLKKFSYWFIIFGLSYLVADVFGWTDQGRAFMYLSLGGFAALMLIFTLIILIAGVAVKEKLIAFTGGSSIILITIIAVAIELFATWGATKLLHVDFFIAYQLITFGACLVPIQKKESN